MPTIMISILPDGMPVDKMEETEESNVCPLPTQDIELNIENRQTAIDQKKPKRYMNGLGVHNAYNYDQYSA